MPDQDKATKQVYRPNSMRKVSAIKELNRLKDRIKELQAQLDREHKAWELMLEAAEAENQELLERLKSLQYQTLGWAYADACQMADKGIDIRQVEVPIIIERMKRDFNMGKHNDQ
jgi:vacuolar-type H+-ATPase subunit I/STV1